MWFSTLQNTSHNRQAATAQTHAIGNIWGTDICFQNLYMQHEVYKRWNLHSDNTFLKVMPNLCTCILSLSTILPKFAIHHFCAHVW